MINSTISFEDSIDISRKANELYRLYNEKRFEMSLEEFFARYFRGEFDRELGLKSKTIDYCYSGDYCSGCSNNPANGGSGICHCVLGNRTKF